MPEPVAPTPSSLAGPASLALRRLSWLGPLARLTTRTGLRPAQFTVANKASSPVALTRVSLDPLNRIPMGTTASSAATRSTW